jgi:hypothetical protein
VDGGRFTLSIGTYTTISKAPQGGAINWEESCYLEIIQVDIAFRDWFALGGYQYALIFVDWATRYNWVFGLKDLSSNSSLLAFHLFCGDAGSYAHFFVLTATQNVFAPKSMSILLTTT